MKQALSLLLILCTASQANRSGEEALELGKKHYEAGRHMRALDLFGKAIDGAKDVTVRNKAYYHQALALYELGFNYSAYVSFRNVLSAADSETRPFLEKAVRNSVLIADRLNMVDRIGRGLDKIQFSTIPPSSQGFANYAVGSAALESGETQKAESRLKSVAPDNSMYPKAMFLLGVIATRNKNYSEAASYFRKTIETARTKELLNLQELARLNLARTTYALGQLEQSIELYSQFSSGSAHWLTILLEASWPLLRVHDTTVSLGNLHTVISPFYREELVGEAYVLRSTILYSLCKYEEMRQTLAQFFEIYEPVIAAMQRTNGDLAGGEEYFRAMETGRGLSGAFLAFSKRDPGFQKELKVLRLLRSEKQKISSYGNLPNIRKLISVLEETIHAKERQIGEDLRNLHQRKLRELLAQREQANYLKVEIVTGEKDLIESQEGLPPKRIVDVQTDVSSGYRFWPFIGEFWEDELGAYVYTTESSCVQ